MNRAQPHRPPHSQRDGAAPPSEGELARFFQYSHDLLAILDAHGTALAVSASIESLLGYAARDLEGRSLMSLVHPEDRAAVDEAGRQLCTDRPVLEVDARVLDAAGRSVPVRWLLALGQDGRIYATGHDRTAETIRADAALMNETAELRLRTAMELHDGILQTLTGASLQIAVARRLVGQDPSAAEEVLATLGATISAEQREMRLFVDQLKGQSPLSADTSLHLADDIAAMLDRVRAIWGLEASLEAKLDDDPPAETGRHVVRVIQEATVNAARHGGARSVAVRVEREGSDIAIRITDDGHGFPFLGDLDTAALRERRLGPLSLKHRVQNCGGRLAIRSTRQGATVSIWLPAPLATGA